VEVPLLVGYHVMQWPRTQSVRVEYSVLVIAVAYARRAPLRRCDTLRVCQLGRCWHSCVRSVRLRSFRNYHEELHRCAGVAMTDVADHVVPMEADVTPPQQLQ
jgi:hypothetical protein